jgi:predicted phosphoribosyltransferase
MKINNALQNETADQAAHHLVQQLYEHASSTAIVVAASPSAMELAALLANLLNLPLEIIPSRVIRHPGNPARIIGSVTVDEFEIDNKPNDIPQDYIAHQLLLTQASVRKDYESYYSKISAASFRNKTIILIDSIIDSPHPVVACLKSIRRQQPENIIVAALYMSSEAIKQIGVLASQLTYFETISNELVTRNRNNRALAVQRLNQFRDEHAMV